jgi:hypothetical protein
MFSEAQTGKNMLDTHFSYVSMLLRKYVDSGNDIQTGRLVRITERIGYLQSVEF